MLNKKIHDKELELVLMQFKKICKLSKRILNNMSKSHNLGSKPREKYKSHTKGNIDLNKVKKKLQLQGTYTIV